MTGTQYIKWLLRFYFVSLAICSFSSNNIVLTKNRSNEATNQWTERLQTSQQVGHMLGWENNTQAVQSLMNNFLTQFQFNNVVADVARLGARPQPVLTYTVLTYF